MSARHPETQGTITKKRATDKVNNAFSTIQKILTYQLPIPPPPLPVAGGGISAGSGTTFPILYPIAELGNQTNTISINLANQNLHYQKMVINTAGTTNISFDGLLLNKAIVFTLDVSIGVAGVVAVNWPANLFNLPTLPIVNGSRYELHIAGFRDGTEERYTVVGSSLSGSGGSNHWSDIIIDVDKDMLGFGLSDLSFISLEGSAPTQHSDFGVNSNYSVYDFIDSVNTNIGHIFQINNLGYFQIIHNMAATPHTDFLYAQVPFNMNNFGIYNINDLEFNSTGLFQKITTSGDGKVYNFFSNSIKLMDLSPETAHNGGVLEVFTYPSDVSSFASIKVVSNISPAVNNRLIGEYSFDGLDSLGLQQSYAQIRANTTNTDVNNLSGSLFFQLWNNSVPGSPFIFNVISLSGDRTVGIGLNMQANNIFNSGHIKTSTTNTYDIGSSTFTFAGIYMNTLNFKTTANGLSLSSSGDGSVLNFNVNGNTDLFNMTGSALGGFGTFQVNRIGQIKVTNLLNNPATLNEVLGLYAFDGYNGQSTHTQITYGEISAIASNVTHPNEAGDIQVYSLSSGAITQMFTFSGKTLQNISVVPFKVDQGGGNPPLIIDNLGSFAAYGNNGGHLFENQSKTTFYFGAFKPNVFYQGITMVVNARSNSSYIVDATNGQGSDLIITMTDNSFTRNCQLPNANDFTARFLIVKNLGTQSVFLTTVSSQTVDGMASGAYTLNQYNSAILFSSGGQWYVAAKV